MHVALEWERMKKCFKCLKNKPLNQFYTHKQMGDKHLGKCKDCTKKDAKKRYEDPVAKKKIVEYERLRFKNPKRKNKIREYQLKRRNLHPGKERAYRVVFRALRTGKIIKLPCMVCGNSKSQAHHQDYRSPLKVKWLCFKHHREQHGQKVSS